MEKLTKLKNVLILGVAFATVFVLTTPVLAAAFEDLDSCIWISIGSGGAGFWFCS